MNNDNFREEMRKICYGPAMELVKALEDNFDQLSIEQKKDLEKLKFGLKMFDLEQEEKNQAQRDHYKWNLNL